MPEKEEQHKPLAVSASPHIYRKDDTRVVMLSVVAALIPVLIVSIVFFGLNAIRIVTLCVAGCVFFEWLCLKMFKNQGSISDGSAVVSGLLLAFNLPPASPWWLILIGSMVAMLLGKHIFGGLGHNPFNPALVARVFLLISWPVEMTTWSKTRFMTDGTTSATPLGILKTDGLKHLHTALGDDKWNLALGNVGGSIGEMSAVALLIGAAFLLYRGYITWHIPVSFFASVFIFTGIFYFIAPDKYADPGFHLLAGGLFIGALFMATDMVTTPITPLGMLLFGLGCGIITSVIRLFGGYPEGVSFAILIMNGFTPVIDRFIKPKTFGTGTKT